MRILLWLIIGAALYWAVRELRRPMTHSGGGTATDGEEMVRDPVCGVYLPVGRAVSRRTNGGRVYFCSRECEKKFSDRS